MPNPPFFHDTDDLGLALQNGTLANNGGIAVLCETDEILKDPNLTEAIFQGKKEVASGDVVDAEKAFDEMGW